VTGRQLLTGLFGKSNVNGRVFVSKCGAGSILVADGKDGGVNLTATLA
jgi:hypothetical protein